MKQQIQAFQAEIYKNRSSKIRWVTFVAFALAPLFGGVFMLLMGDKGVEGLSGGLKTKAVFYDIAVNWESFLSILSQAVGVGGVLIFGFVISWLFGREYSEGTAKDLLALPISRVKILNAKFAYYVIWCVALVCSNLLVGLLIGALLQLPGWSIAMFMASIKLYFLTTFLVLLVNTPIAFFALYGKGYLVPLGVVAITLVLGQIIGALGFGQYFPWSVPGILSGSGGAAMQGLIQWPSYLLIGITGVLGYAITIFWWTKADQF